MSQFNRTIPIVTRLQLRQEVNFGCPVENCGSPFLTYHHFDPPYRILAEMDNPSHNSKGIIALCHQHADHADGGSWTNDQLQEMKKHPFLTDSTRKARFNHKRKQVILRAGNLSLRVGDALILDDERIIGFQMNKNYELTLNLLLRDSTGETILQMENNDWIINTRTIIDLNCPPQGKELEIKSKDKSTNFKIRFNDYSIEELKEELGGFTLDEVKKIKGLDDKQIKQTLGLTNKQLKNKKHSFSNNNISSLIDELSNEIPTLMITITGIIHYRNNPITITKNSFSYKGIMLRGNLFVETGPICLKGGNIIF